MALDLHKLPLDDAKTYRMLSEGLNVGVFQLNKGWVKGTLRDVRPDRFEDIVALLALIRPGSMDTGGPKKYAQHKREGKTTPDIHPELNDALEPVLRETYGILVYQEQVLSIIKEITDWGYGQADLIFYAMRKKDQAKLESSRPAFFGASKYSPSATACVWDMLVAFGDYGFNKAHSVAYAYTTYWTAYLKANHPAEFIAALMTHEDDQTPILESINEAYRLGIAVLPPSINVSALGFTPTKEGIRYGLGAIRDVGPAAIESILDLRPFTSADDFFRRADDNVLQARVLSALIRSGALVELWSDRAGLMGQAESLARLSIEHRRKSTFGERPLFRIDYTPYSDGTPVVRPWAEIAQGEIETIGLQLTQPKIVLKIARAFTASESQWLSTVLLSRDPVSEVYLELGGFRSKTSMKSSTKGLASAVSKIGIEMVEE